MWGYGLNTFAGEPEASEAIRKLFYDSLKGYWDPRMNIVMDDNYRGVLTHISNHITLCKDSINFLVVDK